MFCVSSMVCTWGMHEGFVPHTQHVVLCAVQEQQPYVPLHSPHSCPPACSNTAQHGCSHGQLQLSGDEVPCWGASQSGCCATGFCLLIFQGWKCFLCPPHSTALALCELQPCQEWPDTAPAHKRRFV